MGTRHWLGVMLALYGAFLLLAAERRRARALAAPPPEALSSSLTVLGEIVRPLVLFGLAYLGLKVSLVYLAMDGGRWFSLLDLGGLLFLLAAYGRWLVVRTRYRLAEPVPVVSGAQAAAREGTVPEAGPAPALGGPLAPPEGQGPAQVGARGLPLEVAEAGSRARAAEATPSHDLTPEPSPARAA